MRFRRKPITYEAFQSQNGGWVVTNCFTREKKVFTDKEFRQQFEREPDLPEQPKKKYEPKNYAPIPYEIDEVTGEVKYKQE